MPPTNPPSDEAALQRIAEALDRLSPPQRPADLSGADAFVWSAEGLRPAQARLRAPLSLILEADAQKEKLLANTRRFAARAPANNALLWGARGAGKSALVKAVHATVAAEGAPLKLVEVSTQDLARVGELMAALRAQDAPVILFLDDLSFQGDELALKALKPALDGGLAADPSSLIVYATSNRRHLVARDARENSDDLLWKDTAEEHRALADRFGLWLGFHALDQNAYLRIVRSYAAHFKLGLPDADLEREALLWSRTRAARSGRTAWQFTLDLAARLDKPIAF